MATSIFALAPQQLPIATATIHSQFNAAEHSSMTTNDGGGGEGLLPSSAEPVRAFFAENLAEALPPPHRRNNVDGADAAVTPTSARAENAAKCLALALRPTKWALARRADPIDFYWWQMDGVELEFRWPRERSASPASQAGGSNAPNPVVIFVQKTLMASLEQAVNHLRSIIANARCIRRLSLNIQVSTSDALNTLLAEFTGARRNVRLEELHVRRRYVGQQLPAVARIIREHTSTLRIVGKIGLGEAIQSLHDQVHLQRLSVFNFDLVDGQDVPLDCPNLAQKTRFYIRRLAGFGRQGLCIDHLSYTAFTGFELTRMPALDLLRSCKVKSLRLTMQKGVAITDSPTNGALLPELQRLELVGALEVQSERLSQLFPALEHFMRQEQDLVTGAELIARARLLSEYVPDYLLRVPDHGSGYLITTGTNGCCWSSSAPMRAF